MKEVKLSTGDTVFIRASVSYPIYQKYMAIMAKMVRMQGFKSMKDYENADIKLDVAFTSKLEYIPMMIKHIELKDGTNLSDKDEILTYFDEIEIADGEKLDRVIDTMFGEAAKKINRAGSKKKS